METRNDLIRNEQAARATIAAAARTVDHDPDDRSTHWWTRAGHILDALNRLDKTVQLLRGYINAHAQPADAVGMASFTFAAGQDPQIVAGKLSIGVGMGYWFASDGTANRVWLTMNKDSARSASYMLPVNGTPIFLAARADIWAYTTDATATLNLMVLSWNTPPL